MTDDIVIGDGELTERFLRSSGPGGQNVNKVSTAVELRFDAARCPALSESAKARLKAIAGRRWTRDGEIVLHSEEARSQARNRELARARLADMIVRALAVPERRIATSPTLASRRRRIESKKARGRVKSLRGKPAGADLD